jgi:crotonobetainyl-CoA:carnitine CoA-transferase CaiB-like acyl-CoA transferase
VPGALDGLTILELGGGISAPYCTKLLGDLGADVLKVEAPSGDPARRMGPFPGDRPHPEASGLFTYLNTNKRSVGLNLAAPDGRELLDRLLERVDLLVENLEIADLDSGGLWPGDVRSRHPRLVVTSISPYGRSGPRCRWAGHGIQASAGSSVAFRTGDPARSPLAKPLNEPDFLGGVHGAAASLVALRVIEMSGVAQHADIALQDILASVTSGPAISTAVYGQRAAATRTGHRVVAFQPWTVLPVADGYMEFITMQERHWRSFLEYLGNPGWGDDPRFGDMISRGKNVEALDPHLRAAVARRTRAELWEACRERGISFQPVQRIDELVHADHLKQRGYFQDIRSASGETMRVPGAPYKLSATPWELRRPAPGFAEHTAEVLHEFLGMKPGEMAARSKAGVLW